MERYILSARLKPHRAFDAEKELAGGPPFDPAAEGLAEHAAYLADDRVYLVFEGDAARTTAYHLAREHIAEVSRWQELVTGFPSRVAIVPPKARCLYRWRSSNHVE